MSKLTQKFTPDLKGGNGMSTTTSVKAKNKTKAPNWTSYFGRAKKKIRVIYFIEFRARNKSRTCYMSLKKIAETCNCSVDTVYDAITLALSIGILEKMNFSTIFAVGTSGQMLWNRQVLLTWVGDTAQTAGEEAFGQASRFFADQNPAQTPVENPVYNLMQGTSLKEKKEEEFSLPLEKTKEQLKCYPEAQISQFWEDLKEIYKNKKHFLKVDLGSHIAKFKRNNPLKRCSSCGETHLSYGSYCDPCWNHYKRKEEEKALEREREAGKIEVPDWQKFFKEREYKKTKEAEKAKLERLLQSHIGMIDIIENEFRAGRLSEEDYLSLTNLRKEKIQELESKLLE